PGREPEHRTSAAQGGPGPPPVGDLDRRLRPRVHRGPPRPHGRRVRRIHGARQRVHRQGQERRDRRPGNVSGDSLRLRGGSLAHHVRRGAPAQGVRRGGVGAATVTDNRVTLARSRWQEYRWTNALLATTDSDEINPTSGPLSGLTFTVKDTFAAKGLE